MTRPLRILHIASGDLWAGAEVQAFTLIAHLARMPQTEVAAVVFNRGILADKLRRNDISEFVLDEQEIGSVRIFAGLRAVLRSWNPDVIHTHREKENILGSLANRSCRNIPSVRTVHGAREHVVPAGLSGARSSLIRGVDRWCGRVLQQRIIAVTKELELKLQDEFQAEKIVVIENGVDVEAVRESVTAAQFRGAAPEATHIGIAGRLVTVKRVDLFLDMAALLLREQPGIAWRFHVFGEGPMRPDLETRSGRLRLGDKVSFHGHREDIAACVAGLDVLVICSDHEGMPMIALEAAALGVPTVAHAVGGLIQVVPDELLVARQEAAAYGEVILRALGAEGRTIAADRAGQTLKRFSARANAERIRALYEQVVTEARAGGSIGGGPESAAGECAGIDEVH